MATTFSVHRNEVIEGSHEFTVRGYSLLKGLGVRKSVRSEIFTVGGWRWAVYFYPDGRGEDDSMYVSVYFGLVGNYGPSVRVTYELKLLDQSGKGKHITGSPSDPPTVTVERKAGFPMYGYRRFAKKSTLDDPKYVKNDCLVIQLSIGVIRSCLERPTKFSIDVPPSDMIQGFKDLLDSEVGSDVVFEVGNKTFRAHKSILAARSPVFKALFFDNGDCNIGNTMVKNFEPSIFKAMLLFIYTDKLPDISEIGVSKSIPTSTILLQHLLVAADTYKLDRLKLLCESKLCEEINADSVLTTLELAKEHNLTQLKNVCAKFSSMKGQLKFFGFGRRLFRGIRGLQCGK